MPPAVADDFALQHAIDRAESVTRYLDARRPEQVAASLESVVQAGIAVGEALPQNWRLAFHHLLRVGDESWSTVGEYEAVRRLFFTTREAMDKALRAAEAWQAQTGRKAEGLDRLLKVVDEAGRLEEEVFRHWPSFAEPRPPVNLAECLPVDESLAEAFGITIEEARRKLAEHKHKYHRKGMEEL